MKQKQKSSRPYEEGLDERLRDPMYVIEYLNSILEEKDADLLLLGLRDVARAHGFSYIAEQTGLNHETLYKALSKGKNPRIGTVLDLLSAMGCRIKLEPVKKAARKKVA
jgi:probable addiction module antidote protein